MVTPAGCSPCSRCRPPAAVLDLACLAQLPPCLPSCRVVAVGDGWMELDRWMPFPGGYTTSMLPVPVPVPPAGHNLPAAPHLHPPPTSRQQQRPIPPAWPRPPARDATVRTGVGWQGEVHADNPSLQDAGIERLAIRFK